MDISFRDIIFSEGGDNVSYRDTSAAGRNFRLLITDFIQKNRGKKVFLEHEVKGLLGEMGLPVPKGVFIGKGEPLAGTAHLGYPLVVKVSSRKIVSKSDLHGVSTGIRDDQALREAFRELMQIDGAEGVLVEEMAPQGLEVIVGGVVDVQFGPVMMFGLGGVFVELFKDVSFGLAPLTREEALRIVKEVKGYRLLEEYRGRPRADIGALADIIVPVSHLMATGTLEEIDLNPVALYPDGAMVLDAKMSVHLS
jgi:succinyl-CoA synthetase beta subunit